MQDRPELDPRQSYYFSVYKAVERGRPVGGMQGVPLPLPVVQVVRDYCDLFYIQNLDERARLLRYVTTLDDAYLEFAAERAKQK